MQPITEADLGLRVLYDGTKDETSTETDLPVEYVLLHALTELSLICSSIVAVHGLGAHPDDTWCKKLDTGDGKVTYVNWLNQKGMLPVVVPRARIMRYGYGSRWFGEEAVKTKASSISQPFLFDLKDFRKVTWTLSHCKSPLRLVTWQDVQDRLLIFITHSFGGLVVLRVKKYTWQRTQTLTVVDAGGCMDGTSSLAGDLRRNCWPRLPWSSFSRNPRLTSPG